MKKIFRKKNIPQDISVSNLGEEDESFFVKHKIDNNDSFSPLKKNTSSKLERNYRPRMTDEEVQKDLMEIYSENGNLPDFKTIKIKKKRPFLLSFLYYVLFLAIAGAGFYFVSDYIKSSKDVSSVLEIKISAPDKVALGEDFFYEIAYRNNSNYTLSNVDLEFNYPENFIVAEIYSIDKYVDNKNWKISEIGPKISGTIKVRGKIINKEGFNNLLAVKSKYGIKGISSLFSKDAFSSVSVSSIPFKIEENYSSTVLVGEEYSMEIKIPNFPKDKISDFQLFFNNSETIVLSYNEKDNEEQIKAEMIKKVSDKVFQINPKNDKELKITFKYKASGKIEEEQFLSWGLKYVDESGKEFIFLEKNNLLDVIKSDLYLNLNINDSSEDFPVNFSDELNYVIKYSNKGDKTMKDLIIMAVFEGDFIDLNSVKDSNHGKVSRKTISWSYSDLSDLRELGPGQSGEIKFSLNVADAKKISYNQKMEIKSYTQFSIGNIKELEQDADRLSDNRSNIIVNRLNSDLSIKEQVLYFDEDNIPVGSGPLPPVVGEKTTFRYYWTLKNTLHELKDLKLELDLPAYVIWNNSYKVSAGNLNFDDSAGKVVFNISRWPLGVDKVDISFDVSVIPTESEYNKIIILSSGSKLEAMDVETNTLINKKTDVKTSKLEDDSIAAYNNDGRVK